MPNERAAFAFHSIKVDTDTLMPSLQGIQGRVPLSDPSNVALTPPVTGVLPPTTTIPFGSIIPSLPSIPSKEDIQSAFKTGGIMIVGAMLIGIGVYALIAPRVQREAIKVIGAIK